MQRLRRFALYALASTVVSGLSAHRARADEKGDALLRQVRTTAQTLTPIVGEYTVTLHNKTGEETEQNQYYLTPNGNGWRGCRILPQSIFNLFNPVTRVPADAHYLGRKSVGGETYDVVELKLPTLTFQLYIGDDGLIHRAHTTVGTAVEPPPFFDPKTGKQARTIEEMLAATVTSPTKTDFHDVDIVVTSYHKPRIVPPRPDLPPPLRSLASLDTKPDRSRAPVRMGLSPDGTRVALAFAAEGAQIFDIMSGNPLAVLDAALNIKTLVFSPDGKRLAASGDGLALTLYNVQSGRKLFALEGVFSALQPVFTPDGKRLVCANSMFTDNPTQLLIWDTETGRMLPPRAVEGAERLAFSPDGKRLVTLAGQDDTKRLLMWDAATWTLLHSEPVRVGRLARPVYSPDGQWIALAGPNSILLFNGASGQKQRELAGDTGDVFLLQFAADGKTLIALDTDMRGDMPSGQNGVVVWDTGLWQKIGTGSLPRSLFMSTDSCESIAADGKTFAVADFNRAVRIWAVPGR